MIFWKITCRHSNLELLHHTWKLRNIWSLIIFFIIFFEIRGFLIFRIHSFIILEFFTTAVDKILLVIILHIGNNFRILNICGRINSWNKLLMSFCIFRWKCIVINWWICMRRLLLISSSFVNVELLYCFSQTFVIYLLLHYVFFVLSTWVFLFVLFLFIIYYTIFLTQVLWISFWLLHLIVKSAFFTLFIFKFAITILILFN